MAGVLSGSLGGSQAVLGGPDVSGTKPASSAPGEDKYAKTHAPVSLVCEGDGVPSGGEVAVGLLFNIEPKWHIYWNGRNDSGSPPEVEWTLPKGFKIGPLQWPGPTAHIGAGDLLDHVYEGRTLLMARLSTSTGVKAGETITIRGKMNLLVCNEACVPETAEVTLSVRVLPAGTKASTKSTSEDVRRAFEDARARMPRPMGDPEFPGSVTWSGREAQVRFPGAESVCFFPSADCTEYAEPIKSRCGNESLTLAFSGKDAVPLLSGVVEVKRGKGPSVFLSVNARPDDWSPGKAPLDDTPRQDKQK